MTWAEWKAEVSTGLLLNANRLGAEDFVAKQILLGASDLQGYIDSYRWNQKDTFVHAQMADDGEASVGTLEGVNPSINDVIIRRVRNDGYAYVYPCDQWDWNKQYQLIDGTAELQGNRGLVSFDPASSLFYIYPKLQTGEVMDDTDADWETAEYTFNWEVLLWWDGKKTSYEDTDTVTLDDEAAAAVAHRVNAYCALYIESNATLHKTCMELYLRDRSKLWRERKHKKRLNRSSLVVTRVGSTQYLTDNEGNVLGDQDGAPLSP